MLGESWLAQKKDPKRTRKPKKYAKKNQKLSIFHVLSRNKTPTKLSENGMTILGFFFYPKLSNRDFCFDWKNTPKVGHKFSKNQYPPWN